jgi:hypothetical protein
MKWFALGKWALVAMMCAGNWAAADSPGRPPEACRKYFENKCGEGKPSRECVHKNMKQAPAECHPPHANKVHQACRDAFEACHENGPGPEMLNCLAEKTNSDECKAEIEKVKKEHEP